MAIEGTRASFERSTHSSGDSFEDHVADVVKRYAHGMWRNIEVETLLTAKGTTEVDMIFCLNDVVYVVELKNVRAIEAAYNDGYWKMYGFNADGEYKALNVIEQNNIHVKSFLDLYYASRHEFPVIASLIIVPNGCDIPEDLRSEVFTERQLIDYLSSIQKAKKSTVNYILAAMLSAKDGVVRRPDFVALDMTGTRGRKGGKPNG